jgi:hypothetical protein
MGIQARMILCVAASLLLASQASAQEEFVLIGCDAELRAGIFERSSVLRIATVDCAEATGGYGAWQARLVSRNGDLVQVETLSGREAPGGECSGGPIALWPLKLKLFVPEQSLVSTVAAPTEAKSRDGRIVQLKLGVPVHRTKGKWHRVRVDGADVEVPLGPKQLVTVFGPPPVGRCSEVDPPAEVTVEPPPLQLPPEPTRLWVARQGTSVFLPTREEIGEVWTQSLSLDADASFGQGLFRCGTDAPFEWIDGGPAPLCFMELVLNLVEVTPEPEPTPEPVEAEPLPDTGEPELATPPSADPPSTSDPAP